jgi:peroxiredoxin
MQGQSAPDFELQDTNGKSHRLSDYRGQKNIVLAFLRGFM